MWRIPCIFLLSLLPNPSQVAAQTSLSTRAVNYSAYNLESERIRHSRFELHLLQNAQITASLSTRIEGRFRFDAALYPGHGPFDDLPRDVRDDEMLEAEARQIYLDYLSEAFALKLGLQQVDWIESLSPRTSDVLTPLDLRHGGSGNASDIIEPVFALSLNHRFLVGTLDWLFVPVGKSHRLPKGQNGYGYYEALEGDSAEGDVDVVTTRTKRHISESEGGLRWLTQYESLEFTLLAYHGHQRYPALRISPLDPANLQRRSIEETFPQANTFGFSTVYGGEALVSRFMVYYEPKRRPAQFLVRSIGPAPTYSLIENPEYYERRTRIGLGLDYVFSKHLKVYSEHFMTRTEKFMTGDNKKFETQLGDKSEDTFTNSIRLTNETFDRWLFTLDASVTGPRPSRSFSPQVQYTMDAYRVSAGANIFAADRKNAALAPLDKSDQVYVMLESFFDVGS